MFNYYHYIIRYKNFGYYNRRFKRTGKKQYCTEQKFQFTDDAGFCNYEIYHCFAKTKLVVIDRYNSPVIPVYLIRNGFTVRGRTESRISLHKNKKYSILIIFNRGLDKLFTPDV